MTTESQPALQAAAEFLMARRGDFIRAFAAALVATAMVFTPDQLTAQTPLESGSPAAAAPKGFIMHDTAETQVALHFEDSEARMRSLADFQGRVVLLNIWATWCPPCVKEIPALDRLAAALHDTDVAVVAVSVDRKGIDAVRKAFADLDVRQLALYIDTSGQALRTVRGVGLPTSLLLDREGRELGRVVGAAAWDDGATAAFLRQVGAPATQTGRRDVGIDQLR
jgi:thiol-disulfide isomerase/thioredoxin